MKRTIGQRVRQRLIIPPVNYRAFAWLIVPVVFRVAEIAVDSWKPLGPAVQCGCIAVEVLILVVIGKLIWDPTPPMAFAENYFETFLKPLHACVSSPQRTITPALKDANPAKAEIQIIVPRTLPDVNQTPPYVNLIVEAKQAAGIRGFGIGSLSAHDIGTPTRTTPFDVLIDDTSTPNCATIFDVPRQLPAIREYADHARYDRGITPLKEFYRSLTYQVRRFNDTNESKVGITILRFPA